MKRVLMMTVRQGAMALLVLVLANFACAQTKPSADLIITNAKIWTVDKTRPHAEALAVLNKHIVTISSTTKINT